MSAHCLCLQEGDNEYWLFDSFTDTGNNKFHYVLFILLEKSEGKIGVKMSLKSSSKSDSVVMISFIS